MKNILLIDRGCKLIESLSQSTIINVAVTIVENEKQKNDLQSKYNINTIYAANTINDLYKNYKCSLDYNIIKQYRHTQLKVENFFSRFSSDINLIQYLYINALLFWTDYFANNSIDTVILNGVEHGFNFDSVILDVAVANNKKVYIIETALTNGDNLLTGMIFDYTQKSYLPLDIKKYNLENINIDEYLYYQITNKKTPKVKDIRKKFRNILHKLGGQLLVMFVLVLIKKYKSVRFSIKISWWTYFKNFLHVKKMFKYYNSLSVKFDSSKKYVFYALHMEPEAATQARTTFSNQLIIIKTIAQNLPDGWKLYVKEHPHQLSNLNNSNRYYYLAGIERFRTEEYYNEILKIPNVKLLDINTKSRDIINSAQAISSINGTIILEAIVSKKPILLFSQDTTPFQNLNDVFHIKNLDDVTMAIESINSNFKANYNDFNKLIDNYFFKVDSTKKTDYKSLIEYLASNKNI